MTPDELVAAAYRAVHAGTYWGEGQCLKSVRTLAGAPGGTYDAITAWHNAEHKYPGMGQAGTFDFWSGGSRGHGHVAISLGTLDRQHWSISLDVFRTGRMDPIPTVRIHDDWGLTYVGHSTDINGVNIEQEWDEMATKAEIRDVMDNAIAAALPKIAAAAGDAAVAKLTDALTADTALRGSFRNNVRVPVDNELDQRHLGTK